MSSYFMGLEGRSFFGLGRDITGATHKIQKNHHYIPKENGFICDTLNYRKMTFRLLKFQIIMCLEEKPGFLWNSCAFAIALKVIEMRAVD